ncbi:mechanosensitive ion channel family protein [Saprospiraceae bacterium]|jgi:MscS family membrane protein|nr:mechanosensitive ion channel family protein [Bacteroidota bacterium]MDB4727502.1 mechanosensitive ion channel family protein [Saprospiraceae bacterium]MDF1863492.1 mechanosensitive ion channel family protein [Saprospiraceae bacterium]
MKNGIKFLIFSGLLLFSSILFSQTKNAPNPTLESPFNSMWVHLYYLQNETYSPEISARTISNTADTALAIQRAVQLKQILDGKGLFVYLENITQDSNFIDSTTNKPYYTPFPNELPEVYLEKINSQWFYSQETVRLIPTLHKEVYPLGSDILVNLIPHQFGQKNIFGIAIWQVIGGLIFLILLGVFDWILSKLLKPIVRKVSRSRLNPNLIPSELISKIARLVSILFSIQLLKLFLPALLFSPETMESLTKGLKIISTIVLLLLLIRILDVVTLYLNRFAEQTTSKLDEQLIPLLKKLAQIIFVIMGVIRVLSLLDVNVTALIAGVSIGGLALALAAQDTVKNLIGSVMIFLDKPFQIGDWIDGGGVSGSVVEVGFRTTRLKQTDSSIISVPNGTIANMAVKNLGVRVYRLFQFSIGVTYDTPTDLLQKFTEGLKEIILNHPKTMKENYYVYFNEMAASSLNILFRTSLEVSDFESELKTKEELLFGIVQLAETLGIQFAFPSTSMYVEQLPGKDGNAPTLETDSAVLDEKLKAFIAGFKSKNA